MKFLIALLLSTLTFANSIKVFNTQIKKYVSYESFIEDLPENGFIVLGEFHNDEVIQNAQARIIFDKGESQPNFKLMWEFLNFTDQTKIDLEYLKFLNDEVTAKDFVSVTAGKQNTSYAPLFEVSKHYANEVVALNLPREIKQKVIREGIESVDPTLIPESHVLGGESYFLRFKEAMGGHAPEDMVKKYFLAQSLTDSVMGYHAAKNHTNLSFIVAGSFHTDFYDGTIPHLRKLSNESIVTLKVINDNRLEDRERELYLQGDDRFGAFADFIIFSK